jgi:hypothetical protein
VPRCFVLLGCICSTLMRPWSGVAAHAPKCCEESRGSGCVQTGPVRPVGLR